MVGGDRRKKASGFADFGGDWSRLGESAKTGLTGGIAIVSRKHIEPYVYSEQSAGNADLKS